MRKRNGILPNAKEHLGLVILIVFVSLFLIKNVFFNKNLNNDIMVLENPKTYDLNLSSKALVIKDEYLYYIGKNNIEVDNSKVGVDKEIGEVDVSKVDQNFKDYLAEKVQALQEQEDNKDSKVKNIDLEDVLKLSNILAEYNNVFVGIQPSFRQTPPMAFFSKRTVFRPPSAARSAAV